MGAKDIEIYPKETAKFFVGFDKEVFDKSGAVTKFETFEISKNKIIHAVATKIPIYDDKDNLLGILGKTRYLNFFLIHGHAVILSKRELDILVHVVFGLSLKKMAHTLNVSVGSISSYLNRLKEKIDCHSQSEIIHLVRRHSLSAHILEYLCLLEEGKI